MYRRRLEASWERFQQAIADPRGTQARLLSSILAANADSEYGRRYGFAEIPDLATYRRRVPLASFEDLAPYVDRMMNGEPRVLLADPPEFFARTSGTSGAPKHVPYPARVHEEYWNFIGPMLWQLERDHAGSLEHALTVSGKRIEGQTASGVPIGSASGFVRHVFAGVPFWYSAPDEIYEDPRHDLRYYALLFYALSRSVQLLTALNPSTLLTLFKKAEEYGAALADDVERGTLQAGPAGLADLAVRLGPLPPPAPRAAARLRDVLNREGAFIPGAMWPELSVIQTWKGGSSGLYLPSLRARCPGCVIRPLQSSSTEGAFLIPFSDSWNGGVPALLSTVLEFLPAELAGEPEDFVDLAELEPGCGYRLVISNSRGLYRYPIDDVFFVEAEHRGLPVLCYSHRHGLVSSLSGEKLTEGDVMAAMGAALAKTGLTITEFQLGPRWGDPPAYLLVVELEPPPEAPALEALLERFEGALGDGNLEYRAKRDSGRLGHPELVVVRTGEFERQRRAQASALGRSDAQVKQARLRTQLIEPGTFQAVATVGWRDG